VADNKKYVTAIGFVQFDPVTRDANGKEVTDIVVKTAGGDGKQVRITVWPEQLVKDSLGREIVKGDLVAVDGAFSSSTYQDKEGKSRTSLQISAFQLNVNGKTIERKDREVVTASTESGSEDSF
jgi:single-stranded DNA-binding protein